MARIVPSILASSPASLTRSVLLRRTTSACQRRRHVSRTASACAQRCPHQSRALACIRYLLLRFVGLLWSSLLRQLPRDVAGVHHGHDAVQAHPRLELLVRPERGSNRARVCKACRLDDDVVYLLRSSLISGLRGRRTQQQHTRQNGQGDRSLLRARLLPPVSLSTIRHLGGVAKEPFQSDNEVVLHGTTEAPVGELDPLFQVCAIPSARAGVDASHGRLYPLLLPELVHYHRHLVPVVAAQHVIEKGGLSCSQVPCDDGDRHGGLSPPARRVIDHSIPLWNFQGVDRETICGTTGGTSPPRCKKDSLGCMIVLLACVCPTCTVYIAHFSPFCLCTSFSAPIRTGSGRPSSSLSTICIAQPLNSPPNRCQLQTRSLSRSDANNSSYIRGSEQNDDVTPPCNEKKHSSFGSAQHPPLARMAQKEVLRFQPFDFSKIKEHRGGQRGP